MNKSKNNLAIISVAILAAGGIMIETAMNVTFPVLQNVFNTSLNNIQWVTTAYLLAVTVTMTISAYLTKTWGVRKIWLLANIIFIVGTLISGISTSLTILLLGRVLEGVSAGLAMPLMFNLILLLVPKNKIGVWMGVGSMVISLAPSFGPSYGGAIIESLGWRAIFYILMIVPAVSLILGYKTVPCKFNKEKSGTFDYLAFILLSLALVAGILTISQMESGKINLFLLLISLGSLGLFIYKTNRSNKQFLNIHLFKLKSFTLLLIPVTLYMFANLGLGLLIPNYLQSIGHESSFLAGFSLLPGTLIGAMLSPIFGLLYDKIGSKKLLIIGNSIFCISVLIMFFITDELNLLSVIFGYVVFTIGRNMAFSTSTTAALSNVDKDNQNDATAILQASQMFMGAVGTTVAALLGSRNIEVGLKTFFLILFILSLLIFLMFFYQQKKKI